MNTGLSSVLISGPMSHVGKTTVIRALSSYWHRYRADQTMSLLQLPGMQPFTVDEAPDIGQIWQSLSQQQHDHDIVLIEGEGALGTPVTDDTTMANLAWDWRLPTVLVVPARWDAIAPTIAAIALARQSRLDLIGVILNCITPEPDYRPEEMGTMLQSLTQVNLLGTIPFLADVHDESRLCQVASDLLVETIMGKPLIQKART